VRWDVPHYTPVVDLEKHEARVICNFARDVPAIIINYVRRRIVLYDFKVVLTLCTS
jgi:hypothetical protein